MLFAIVMGTLCGTTLAVLASLRLLGIVANRFARRAEQARIIRVVGLVFGAIALFPSIFLAVMAGGTIGMHYAGIVADAVGIGVVGRALVLAAEVIVAMTIVAMLNTALGAVLGVIFARSLYPAKA
ncbi:MAG: hypothetical protein DYH20_03860 [Gammaproteobacteria bacterium PRO9]|nr:hypothetical protein [Gammaproteobacteria bacterium PRO9]